MGGAGHDIGGLTESHTPPASAERRGAVARLHSDGGLLAREALRFDPRVQVTRALRRARAVGCWTCVALDES